MKPSTSARNLTPRFTEAVSPSLTTFGTAEGGQIVHGQVCGTADRDGDAGAGRFEVAAVVAARDLIVTEPAATGVQV